MGNHCQTPGTESPSFSNTADGNKIWFFLCPPLPQLVLASSQEKARCQILLGLATSQMPCLSQKRWMPALLQVWHLGGCCEQGEPPWLKLSPRWVFRHIIPHPASELAESLPLDSAPNHLLLSKLHTGEASEDGHQVRLLPGQRLPTSHATGFVNNPLTGSCWSVFLKKTE